MAEFESVKISPIHGKRRKAKAKAPVSAITNPGPVRVMRNTRVYADSASLADGVAREWMKLAQESIAVRGAFHVVLSGGNTPKALYERLAQSDYAMRPEWSRTFIYFGDERAVPPDHEQSNYRMAKAALLDRVPVPPAQVFRIEAEQPDLKKAALAYSRKLAMTLPQAPNGMPQFDLVLLGMGDDGHVASLFPGAEAVTEQRKLVVPVFVERLNSSRITLTFPLINHARRVMMLVTGGSKAEMLARVFHDKPPANPLPVERVAPVSRRLEWRLDAAAAAQL
jgi:6-phosphogluconolactonase